ncbi:DUF2267 domain-containing protein [Nocardioides panacisoli]|uniref:DUF2267 domain-containing protein n=1 Tax=Nocardioides panacisoli TaxID=627624 RepID=UPI001C6394D3|nr:DUF2267 domain-containing protein [Nocardioides panacisoli]QYJ03488.1 DUF2267 domain-containing protein [Nocardioides panacisoli]
MRYDEFIKTVTEHGGPTDRTDAQEVTRVVLADLGQRLTGDEAQDLAAQLPEELKGAVTEHVNADPTTDDVDEFLRRVAEHLGSGTDPEQARPQVQAVLGTLASTVSAGEVGDLRSQLPAGFAPLFD